MFRSRHLRDAVTAVMLVLFAAAGLWAENEGTLSGSDLLRAIRERSGRTAKPAYENRLAKPTGDELLAMVPAESLFVVRVNNFDYTVSQIDQFLTGVSPVPLGLSMLARVQFAKVLGSPDLKGVNMSGNFVAFGAFLPGEPTETDPISNIFIGCLVPVTDYEQFISGNANVGQPDEKGVSKIISEEMPVMLAAQVGSYALISSGNDYDKLIAMVQSISTGSAAGLTGTLDADEAKRAMDAPIWAYGNIQLASEAFGPMVFGKIEEMKTMMESMKAGAPMGDPTAIMNMYVGILETLMKETKSLSLSVNPTPNVLNITNTISAVPGTDMADMFVADASASQENKLLGYLEDGAMMNFAGKMNTPFWKKFNVKSIDLFAAIAGESMNVEDTAKMKKLTEDAINTLGGSVVFSFSIDAKSKPPFAIKYVLEVKDADKFNKVIEEATEMMNTGGIADFYKNMGMETSFTITRGVDSYKGVSIDSAKLVMKSTDPNSPQGQMIEQMYGDGFEYRWGIVDKLCVYAICGDVDLAIRELIDKAKVGAPKQMAAEMKAALTLLPQAGKADFVATYNYLRLFKMVTAMAPVPMPQMDVPIKSNIVFAGKIGDGRMAIDVALPKEHLTEIMTAFMMIQQQKMQQMRQQGYWTCSMHPQIRMPQKGKCPMCGMELVLAVKPTK